MRGAAEGCSIWSWDAKSASPVVSITHWICSGEAMTPWPTNMPSTKDHTTKRALKSQRDHQGMGVRLAVLRRWLLDRAILLRYIDSGADTPNRPRPLRRTWPTAMATHSRAALRAGSSTRIWVSL